jgi:molybdenum-dependent DNA-binding transcriptional regulator ModE
LTSVLEILPTDDRQDRWARSRQAAFLRELAATHCVSRAARAAGMSRQLAYRLRARLKS